MYTISRSGSNTILSWLADQANVEAIPIWYGWCDLELPRQRSSDHYVVDALLLRDPYNFLASMIKACRHHRPPANASKHVAQWLQGWKWYCHHYVQHGYPHFINFNRWVTDFRYRIEVCDMLGIEFTDDSGASHVSETGGGSSFNGLRFDGSASRMRVLHRYKGFWNDPEYKKLIADPEIKELSMELFNWVPEELE